MDLSIRNLTKKYEAVTALDGVSLDVPAGSFTCFLGPSGCGKTTLLRVIAGLETANEGRVVLGDDDLSQVPARHRNFGVVFQSYSLFPNLTALQNVGYGLECRRWKKADIRKRALEMLDLVDLADQAQKLPSQMSGGQQQRVALARALAPHPSLLLLDEPLSALDAKVREQLRYEIRDIQTRLGITTIMVTHDQEEALEMADQIVVLNGGRTEQVGTPKQLYQEPETDFVAGFIGKINILNVVQEQNGDVRFGSTHLKIDVSGKPAITKLGIRPEAISLSATEAASDNVLTGRIAGISYLGNLTWVKVRPEGRDMDEIIVEIHGDTPDLKRNDAVRLGFSADALRVLA